MMACPFGVEPAPKIDAETPSRFKSAIPLPPAPSRNPVNAIVAILEETSRSNQEAICRIRITFPGEHNGQASLHGVAPHSARGRVSRGSLRRSLCCLLYTSDAADERSSVD